MARNPILGPAETIKLLAERAQGKTLREAGQEVGISERTACEYAKRHPDLLRELTLELQAEAIDEVLSDKRRALRARLQDAADVTSRTGPQSFRVVHEVAGSIGKAPQVLIDQSVTNVVDLSQRIELTPADLAELEAARARFKAG